jgi:hypothetical protein
MFSQLRYEQDFVPQITARFPGRCAGRSLTWLRKVYTAPLYLAAPLHPKTVPPSASDSGLWILVRCVAQLLPLVDGRRRQDATRCVGAPNIEGFALWKNRGRLLIGHQPAVRLSLMRFGAGRCFGGKELLQIFCTTWAR